MGWRVEVYEEGGKEGIEYINKWIKRHVAPKSLECFYVTTASTAIIIEGD